MPTKSQSMEFVKGYKGALGIKAPSSMSVSELNKAIDKSVSKKGFPPAIANKWKKMKLIHDSSPEEMAEFMKSLKKTQLMKGTLGKPVVPPKELFKDKQKKAKAKAKPKAKVIVSAKDFTSTTKLGKALPTNKSGFAKVISVKKSNIIQAKSTTKAKGKTCRTKERNDGTKYKICY